MGSPEHVSDAPWTYAWVQPVQHANPHPHVWFLPPDNDEGVTGGMTKWWRLEIERMECYVELTDDLKHANNAAVNN